MSRNRKKSGRIIMMMTTMTIAMVTTIMGRIVA
jgi:hypothetical protein